jgi:tripartite-type tricarboxylate transporter receptor subunit TctC
MLWTFCFEKDHLQQTRIASCLHRVKISKNLYVHVTLTMHLSTFRLPDRLSVYSKGNSMKTTIRLALGALALACTAAHAQNFPTRPITLVVPFAAGGPTDVVARMMAIPMGKSLGQSVVVENVNGAGGTVGATKVARSAPNGYTIFLHHMGMSTSPALYKKLNFDPLTDFEYIGQVLDVPMTLIARKDIPANNLQELIAYIKANEKKVSMADAGLGAVSNLCGLMFKSAIGININTIPYKGTGPAMNDLLGGQVDVLCDQTTQTVPMIKDGRVKVFGVTTLKRLAALPNVPTLDEQGLKGFEVKVWHGMYAPKGTPAPVLTQINTAMRAAMAEPSIVQRLGELSSEIPSADKMTAKGLEDHLKAEINKWGPVIRKAGVTAD